MTGEKTSTFRGVSFRPREKRWYARLTRNGKLVWSGYYATELEAGYARLDREIEILEAELVEVGKEILLRKTLLAAGTPPVLG